MARLKIFLPVVIWMAVIFSASTDVGSTKHTSRFIAPFLRWLNPNIRDETIKAVQAFIRKSGHVSEYAVLAVLVARARKLSLKQAPWGSAWDGMDTRIVLVFCALYATSDEFHQVFVPSRGASVVDVLIDTAGALAGILLVWYFSGWRVRRQGRERARQATVQS